MKNKLVLSAIALFFSASGLYAQATAAGNFMFGTRLGFSTATSRLSVTGDSTNFDGDSGSSLQFNIAPSIGYLVANNFALGIGMDYQKVRTETPVDPRDPSGEIKVTSDVDLLFGPFGRLYLPVMEDQAFFISSIVGFGHSNDQFDLGNGELQRIETNLRSVSLGVGYTIFATNGFGLETLVKYSFNRSTTDLDIDGVSRSSVSQTRALDFSVGLQIYLGGGYSSYE